MIGLYYRTKSPPEGLLLHGEEPTGGAVCTLLAVGAWLPSQSIARALLEPKMQPQATTSPQTPHHHPTSPHLGEMILVR